MVGAATGALSPPPQPASTNPPATSTSTVRRVPMTPSNPVAAPAGRRGSAQPRWQRNCTCCPLTPSWLPSTHPLPLNGIAPIASDTVIVPTV
jgi:hypothetical protein